MRSFGRHHQPLTLNADGAVAVTTAVPSGLANATQLKLFNDNGGDIHGSLFILGYASSAQTQLWLTHSDQAGDSGSNSFRYIVGFAVPNIGAVSNDGGTETHFNLGDPATNVGVGFDVSTVAQGDITAKLHVHGTGTGFQVDDSGGTPTFRIDDDGSIHVRSGVTLTDDL